MSTTSDKELVLGMDGRGIGDGASMERRSLNERGLSARSIILVSSLSCNLWILDRNPLIMILFFSIRRLDKEVE
jgi:hypothetical protein